MSDNEITIKVTTEVSDEELAKLEEKLQELADSILQPSVEPDDSGVDETGEKMEEEFDKEFNPKVNPDDSGVDSTIDKLSELGGEIDVLSSGAASVGSTLMLDEMVTKAGNVEDSYNRLSLTFRGTGVSIETLKNQSAQLTAATGRSGSQVRDYFNQMGIAGITNTKLLSTSFENMSGRAYQTGTSIEQMEGSVQRMVMSGNAGARMLSRLGISSTALANAMGVTNDEVSDAFKNLSETERLEVLNKAMGDGAEANKMYKDSLQGMKEQLNIAFGGLLLSVGQTILPMIIPLLQTLTQVINSVKGAFKGLPTPIKTIIAGFGAFMLGATAVLGALATIVGIGSRVYKSLNTVYKGYQLLRGVPTAQIRSLGSAMKSAIGTAKRLGIAMLTSARNALTSAYAWLVSKLRIIADTIVKIANTVVTYALAIAEWLLASPILLVVAVVIVAIAILWYLYNTNSSVKAGIDWLIQVFTQLASTVQGAVVGAINKAKSVFNTIKSTINNLTSMIRDGLVGAWNSLKSSVNNALAPLQNAWNTLNQIYQTGKQIIDSGIGQLGSMLGFGGSDIQQSTGSTATWFNNVSADVGSASRITKNSSSTVGDIIINVNGNVNDDKTVDNLVKQLTKVLNFNNVQAGRSV